MTTSKTFALACVLALPLLMPARADAQDGAACTVIPSLPAVIDAPGNYCLAQNFSLNMNSGAALRVNANNVTVDCRDFTITNTANDPAAGGSGVLVPSRYNVLVKNCRLVGGFSTGIYLSMDTNAPTSSFYNRVEDNYILGPYRAGIIALGSAIEVRGNTVYDVGGATASIATGIRVGGSSASSYRFQVVEDNLVAGTVSLDNHGYGIYSTLSLGAVIRGNTISGTVGGTGYLGTAVRIVSGTGNVISGNHLGGAGRANELAVQTPQGNRCFQNVMNMTAGVSGCSTHPGNL